MVILNADHPDVEEFIWCKVKEERKARVLRDAGFDMDLDGSDSSASSTRTPTTRSASPTSSCRPCVDDADWDLVAVIDGRRRAHRPGPRPVAPDRPGVVGVRRPGSAVRHHDQQVAHRATPRAASTARNPCSEYMHLDNSACNLASINLLQVPRLDSATTTLRRRRLHAHGRGDLHRPGDPGRPRRLPDRADRRDQPQVPPARHRLRQPRRAADGARPALRLGRGSGLGGGAHVADDRSRLRHQCPHGQPHGSVRRLRRERGAHAQRAAHAPRRQSYRDRRQRRRARRAARRRPAGVGGGRRATARSTACATARPACSRRPAPSA